MQAKGNAPMDETMNETTVAELEQRVDEARAACRAASEASRAASEALIAALQKDKEAMAAETEARAAWETARRGGPLEPAVVAAELRRTGLHDVERLFVFERAGYSAPLPYEVWVRPLTPEGEQVPWTTMAEPLLQAGYWVRPAHQQRYRLRGGEDGQVLPGHVGRTLGAGRAPDRRGRRRGLAGGGGDDGPGRRRYPRRPQGVAGDRTMTTDGPIEALDDELDDTCVCCQLRAMLEDYRRAVEAAADVLEDVVAATEWVAFQGARSAVNGHLRGMRRSLHAAREGAGFVGDTMRAEAQRLLGQLEDDQRIN